LLVIARDSNGLAAGWSDCGGGSEDGWVKVDDHDDDDDLEDLVLWIEIKKQVAILREGMEEKA
jgi:hypothetical protein